MFDKSKLAERIRSIEGLSADERSALLELLNNQKKYGLVWEEKPEEVEQQLQDQLPVLTEVVEKRIIGAQMPSSASSGAQPSLVAENNNSAPNHILIEGDNLHALTCLSYTHEGKIDVIYIDPPYNTGNKDFVYNDRFVDTEDAYRHSKWLSFMHKRLRIARRLLSDRGVIFISIDDNEQANLKLLCDEVFGEGNKLGTISILNNLKGRSDDKFFATCNEFMLVYAKNKDIASIIGFELEDEELDNDYELQDEISYYKLIGLRKTGTGWEREKRPYMFYPILYMNGEFSTIPDEEFEKIYDSKHKIFNDDYLLFLVNKYKALGYNIFLPKTETGLWGRWRWGRVTFMIQKNVNVDINSAGTLCSKMRATLEDGSVRMKTAKTLWYRPEYDNGSSSKILSSIFGLNTEVFSNPKSLFLLNDLLKISSKQSSTILDFFAGSGTTLHAVMQLNAEDGGHRQCILVTNNENGICENVTYERNRRVINGYTTPRGQQIEGLHNNNLRYYRTTFVPREQNHHNRKLLFNAATDLLCIKNDCYYEQGIRYNGRKLRSDIARLFTQSKEQPTIQGSMLIIYEPDAISIIVRWLKELIEKQSLSMPIKVYIFSDSSYAYTDDFADVLPHIELCALPEAIYRAYIQVLGKTKEITESHD